MDENMALTPYETREIMFYKTDNGDVKVEILLYQENLWPVSYTHLPLRSMSILHSDVTMDLI